MVSKLGPNWGFYNIASLGEQALLKLGRDDDACELARLILSSEAKLEKKWILMSSHGVLGQFAAKRGDIDEADGHFASALEEAKLSRLPMLEVLAARDWKRHVLEPRSKGTCKGRPGCECSRGGNRRGVVHEDEHVAGGDRVDSGTRSLVASF